MPLHELLALYDEYNSPDSKDQWFVKRNAVHAAIKDKARAAKAAGQISGNPESDSDSLSWARRASAKSLTSEIDQKLRDWTPGAVQEQQAAAAANAPSSAGRGALAKFMNDMMGTVSPNDPIFQGLSQLAGATAGRSASMGGFASDAGYGAYMTENQKRNSVMPYLQQRQALGGQAAQALMGAELSDAQLAEQARQFNALQDLRLAEAQNKAAQQNFAAEQNKGGMIGGIIGAGIGAIPGLIGAIPTGGASLSLIGAGAGIGQSIGAGSVQAPRMIGPQSNYSGTKGNSGLWS
jgi:hypothetical protein